MKNKILIIGILATFCSINAFSQWTQDPRLNKNAISLEPLYIVNNGLRVNYERQIINPHHWLEFSSTGYFSYNENNTLPKQWFYDSFDNFSVKNNWGLALEASYKYYPIYFMYISSGITYSHHEAALAGNTMIYNSYVEDGLTYYEPTFEYYDNWKAFDRLGVNLKIGLQTPLYRNFLIGGYFGLGFAKAFYRDDGYVPNKSIISVTYSGVTPLLGWRIGFRF